jgi:hypothetical protein
MYPSDNALVLLVIVVGEEMIPPSIPLAMSISPFDASAMFADAICVGNKLAAGLPERRFWGGPMTLSARAISLVGQIHLAQKCLEARVRCETFQR